MKNDSPCREPLERIPGVLPKGMALPAASLPLLACGAETANTFTLTDGVSAYVSPDIGDLRDPSTYDCYLASVREMKGRLGVVPEIVAHDLHPDYVSTRYAEALGVERLVPVQHHHAHAAACMQENGLDGEILAVTFDGMGLGDDGTVWGGEFLICDLARYERKAHLKPYPLPGGDQGTLYPERMAFSCLASEPALGADVADTFLVGLDGEEKALMSRIVERGIHSPLTSSVGRLFDAVAAMLGFRGRISFPAEAAIGLQKGAKEGVADVYPYEIEDGQLGFGPMFGDILRDMRAHTETGVIAAMFHNTLALGAADMCGRIRDETGLDRVVLSGGVFYNALLAGLLEDALQKRGLRAFRHSRLPPGDACVSFGQAVIASVKEKPCV